MRVAIEGGVKCPLRGKEKCQLKVKEGELPVAHQADLNADFRMVMSEAIAYLVGWQQGSNPIAYAIRAAYLWQNGEYYVYNPEKEPPLCWELPIPDEGEGESAPVAAVTINEDAISTSNPIVVLNNTTTNNPTEYLASERSDFSDTTWQPYDAAPSFTFIGSAITRTVYFKARNSAGESGVAYDTIYLEPASVSIGAGTFTMGRIHQV